MYNVSKEDLINMAILEYGALLKINGKFINKNMDLFMDCSDTGYICEKATYYDKNIKKDREVFIDGMFYVYAGDENFMLCFSKAGFSVISHNKIIGSVVFSQFLSETFYFDDLPSVTLEMLDKSVKYKSFIPCNYMFDHIKEKIGKKKKRVIRRYCKKYGKVMEKGYCTRWKASWVYNGNHYEVIFGYGIDNDEKSWNDTKDDFGFSDTEKRIVDEWFSNSEDNVD